MLCRGRGCVRIYGRFDACDRARRIFQRYRAGITRIICSIGVLTAGIDEDVRCIIMARPTKSPILWVQMIGKVLRRAEGKADLRILDHSSNSLSLHTVDKIFFDKMHDGKRGPDLWSDEEREAAAEAKQALPKLCPECSAVVARHELKCSQCGHEFKPVCEVNVIEGDLVKLGGGEQGRIGATFQDRQTFYRECLGVAEERGWKPETAYYAHLQRYNGIIPPWGLAGSRTPEADRGNPKRATTPMAAEEGDRGLYGAQGRPMSDLRAKKRDRLVAGTFTPLPSSVFASTVWEALSPTAMRLFGFMVGADASVHSGDGRVGFAYDDFVKRGIGRNNIAPALRELEEAGIIKRVWKGHGGENAAARSVSFYRLTTYASDGPQAFLEPLTREEWLTRLDDARKAKDLHHARNGKQKPKPNGVRKERIFSVATVVQG
jgi:hypothetical protein